MVAAVFVAPFLLPTTVRFLAAALSLEDASVALVTSEPPEKVPPALAGALSGFRQIRDCLDPHQLEAAVASLGLPDRLLGPLEELQVPMAQVRQRFGIAGIDPETALNFRDKARMKDVLTAAGIPCARHRLVESVRQFWEFVDAVGFPVVAKPQAGSGSRSTVRLDDRSQAEAWLGWEEVRAQRAVLVEELITGQEHSFDCVFLSGRPVFASVSRYHPTPLQVLETPWIQWAVILPRHLDGYEDILEVGPAAISALGLGTGLVHMEWFRRRDGDLAISEAAVRPPGAQFTTLISHAHDFDLYAAWARLMIHGTFQPPPRSHAVGAVYLRGQGRGQVVAIEGLDRAQEAVEGKVVEVKLPELGSAPSPHYEGDGYVVVKADTTAEVERMVDAILGHVRVVLG